jgi:hypothetical protein
MWYDDVRGVTLMEFDRIRQALNYAASYLDDRIVELPAAYATAS